MNRCIYCEAGVCDLSCSPVILPPEKAQSVRMLEFEYETGRFINIVMDKVRIESNGDLVPVVPVKYYIIRAWWRDSGESLSDIELTALGALWGESLLEEYKL